MFSPIIRTVKKCAILGDRVGREQDIGPVVDTIWSFKPGQVMG